MRRLTYYLCLSLFLSLPDKPIAAAESNAWEASINPQTKERYIPVELWAGTEWWQKRTQHASRR